MGVLIWCVCAPAFGQWFSETREVMGTTAQLQFASDSPEQAKRLTAQVWAELDRLDVKLSIYKPTSELSRLNRRGSQEAVIVSKELFYLLERSQEFNERSAGLFDIRVETFGQLYDLRAHKRPDEQALSQALQALDEPLATTVVLDASQRTVFFSKAALKLDLGGIAKGYSVDRAIDVLRSAGIQQAMVSSGGDARYLGKHDNRPWLVGVRHPRDANKLAVSLPIEDSAVSTSGDYQRFFIDADGKRHHHIFDPRSGKSPEAIVSATVLGPDALTTDAMSTTVLIASRQQALAMINNEPELEAILVDHTGKLWFSDGLVDPQSLVDAH